MVEPKRDAPSQPIMEIVEEDTLQETVLTSDDAPLGYTKAGLPRKRRGRPPGSAPTVRRGRTSGSLRTQIGGMLLFVNMPISILSSKNALDAVEIDALAKALDEECQRNARFRKYVEQMLAVQGGTSLIFVTLAIAGRRVVRNNLVTVPAEIGSNETADAMIGGIISMMGGNGPVNPNLRVMTQQEV